MGEIERDINRMIVTVVNYLNAIKLATSATKKKKMKTKGTTKLNTYKETSFKLFPDSQQRTWLIMVKTIIFGQQ